ncbi:hypothetical protein ACHAP3_011202, partial [Botrytis cinerea]
FPLSSLIPDTADNLRNGLEPSLMFLELSNFPLMLMLFFGPPDPPIVCKCGPAEEVRACDDRVRTLVIPSFREENWTRGPKVGRQADIIPEADSTTHHTSAVASVPGSSQVVSF